MARKKNVKVTKESGTGRNEEFNDRDKRMTRPEFVREIEKGNYPGYHVRKVGGKKAPASNPDGNKKNNLD